MRRSRMAAPGVVAVVVMVGVATGLAFWPVAARAQIGPVEALASRVSDLSFYYGTGGLGSAGPLDPNPWGMRTFGLELLFEVAQIPSSEARRRQAETPGTTRRVLERVEVRHVEGREDTIYHYTVQRVPPPGFGPEDIVWSLEVGIGYGQTEGLSLRDPGLELNATIRNLPALTLYLSHEPTGGYAGMRTGFMRTDALQVVDADGLVYRGRGEAFMLGGVVGYAFPLRPTYLFVEAGYTLRNFPSVEWTATPGPLPPGIPRSLDVSGWVLTGGIQFPVR